MKRLSIISVLICFMISSSCKDFLEAKPDISIMLPAKLKDLQALLDNSSVLNAGSCHLLGEISSDDYFLTKPIWQSLTNPFERNAHIWSQDIFEGLASSEWNNPSLNIFYSNLVLERIENYQPTSNEWEEVKNIKGSAFFFRAFSQFQLSQIFCKTYEKETAKTELGIPLRLDSDMNTKSTRSTVEETYNRILKDLKEAADLLPEIPLVKTRPSKQAALALLARVYLVMQNYEEALSYGQKAAEIKTMLIDYNDVDAKLNFPFIFLNEEVVFHCNTYVVPSLIPSRQNVDSVLFKSYLDTDLRRSCFFYLENGYIKYKGSYSGSNAFFTGIAYPEILLTIAESAARLGDVDLALKNLNILLEKRVEKESFLRVTEQEPKKLLDIILLERRKELVFKGVRWSDLRRLNLEEDKAITLKRKLDDDDFELIPNSSRYTFPIPDDVIKISGMQQNQR